MTNTPDSLASPGRRDYFNRANTMQTYGALALRGVMAAKGRQLEDASVMRATLTFLIAQGFVPMSEANAVQSFCSLSDIAEHINAGMRKLPKRRGEPEAVKARDSKTDIVDEETRRKYFETLQEDPRDAAQLFRGWKNSSLEERAIAGRVLQTTITFLIAQGFIRECDHERVNSFRDFGDTSRSIAKGLWPQSECEPSGVLSSELEPKDKESANPHVAIQLRKIAREIVGINEAQSLLSEGFNGLDLRSRGLRTLQIEGLQAAKTRLLTELARLRVERADELCSVTPRSSEGGKDRLPSSGVRHWDALVDLAVEAQNEALRATLWALANGTRVAAQTALEIAKDLVAAEASIYSAHTTGQAKPPEVSKLATSLARPSHERLCRISECLVDVRDSIRQLKDGVGSLTSWVQEIRMRNIRVLQVTENRLVTEHARLTRERADELCSPEPSESAPSPEKPPRRTQGATDLEALSALSRSLDTLKNPCLRNAVLNLWYGANSGALLAYKLALDLVAAECRTGSENPDTTPDTLDTPAKPFNPPDTPTKPFNPSEK